MLSFQWVQWSRWEWIGKHPSQVRRYGPINDFHLTLGRIIPDSDVVILIIGVDGLVTDSSALPLLFSHYQYSWRRLNIILVIDFVRGNTCRHTIRGTNGHIYGFTPFKVSSIIICRPQI